MSSDTKQQGLLVVTGNDKITVTLKNFPKKVDVFFNKKPHHPCDPYDHHSDSLNWEIYRHCYNNGYKLIINWQVFDIREITWIAHYK